METTQLPYSPDVLRRRAPQRTFEGNSLTEIAFPLGGIGTGTISLGGRGDLRDFEIYNNPNKGHLIPFTFFALWTKGEGGEPVARILEGKIPPPYRLPNGEPTAQLSGVPRFAKALFRGEYPVAHLDLEDPKVPVTAHLKAWNPFIPLNVHDSAIPIAIFEWTFENKSDKAVELSLAATTTNETKNAEDKPGVGAVNIRKETSGLRGLFFSNPDANKEAAAYSTMALITPHQNTGIEPVWYRGGWFDKSHIFWDSFSATGKAPASSQDGPAEKRGDTGTITLHATVPAGGSVTLPVYITWHSPKKENPWRHLDDTLPTVLDTYVSQHYADAWEVGEYAQCEINRLREQTEKWRGAITQSSLPDHVTEAITSQASIIRTNTCFLLADGNFYAWEGSHLKQGSCWGSCTHVWNYEQALAFLFPQLERSMRRTEFLHNMRPTGHMAFRTNLPPGGKLWEFKPCVDGQMGAVMQVYRDWQLSGDDEFLKELWPNVKLAIEYAWTMTPDKFASQELHPGLGHTVDKPVGYDSLWDPDKDGVMEGEQHNTYDIEFFGPNTMCSAIYLGALRAGEEIARYLGEDDKAEEYRGVRESGSAKIDDTLWNGEYYIQKVNVIPEVKVHPNLETPAVVGEPQIPKYQYGEGCLSDQLLGQWAAHVYGLGYLLNQEKVKSAVHSIFKYNFREHLGDEHVVQRVYGLNDEPGLLLCSWPKGGRLTLPFVYSDEVWTGIEYHVAAHLIYEGFIDEGLTVVKAVSDRYAGYNRNPWDQVECGFHYARAMSSWSVKLALDGFSFNAKEGLLGFAPKLNAEDFQTFWSTGAGWGTYHQNLTENQFTLKVLSGHLSIAKLSIGDLPDGEIQVQAPTSIVGAKREGHTIRFEKPIKISAEDNLSISLV